MIAIKLQEKLCNELFQYASAKGVARKLGYDFSLVGSSFAGHRLLNLKCSYSNIKDFMHHNTFPRREGEWIQPEIFEIQDGTLLDGYFQSDFYFEHIEDEIKQDFKLEQTQKAAEILEKYPTDDYCYMHVRGQDYTREASEWLLPKNYWEIAMGEMEKTRLGIKYLVFTDDIEYANGLFNGQVDCMRNDELTDMYCLSHSRYMIMSNSTFSWWSMYLNDNPGFIIGPDRWLNRNRVIAKWADREFVPEGINCKKVNLWV